MRNITDALGWLGYCFCGYALLSLGFEIWRKYHPRKESTPKTKWHRMRGWARTNQMPISVGLAAFVLGMLTWRAFVLRYPIAHEHNVAVYGKFPDGDWDMSSDEEGRFSYRPCDDFNVEQMFREAVGYVAHDAYWEERGECKSIRATGLAFHFKDKFGNYRRIDDARASR